MKPSLIISFLILLTAASYGQADSLRYDSKKQNRYVIWLIPSASANVYGLAIGPIGSEAICNRPYTKYSHGLNIQLIGQGFFTPFYLFNPHILNSFAVHSLDSSLNSPNPVYKRAIHNGLLVSPLGTFTDQVNGVSISAFMSKGTTLNGASINLLGSLYGQVNGISIALINHTIASKGVQLGLFNKSSNLKGIQLGLWNVNESRSLPILNWSF